MSEEFVSVFARSIEAECYDLRRAAEEGVSPAFLAVVASENIHKIVDTLLAWAKEAGEFGCEECGRYYTLREARVEGSIAYCPECGGELQAASCGLCSRHLFGLEEEYMGLRYRGFCFCADCLPKVQRVF